MASFTSSAVTVCYSATGALSHVFLVENTAALGERAARSQRRYRCVGALHFALERTWPGPVLSPPRGLDTKSLLLAAVLSGPAPVHSPGSSVWGLGVAWCDSQRGESRCGQSGSCGWWAWCRDSLWARGRTFLLGRLERRR